MDFFSHQDQPKKHTAVLVAYFGIAIVCIIASVYLASAMILYATQTQAPAAGVWGDFVLWDPQLFLYVVIGARGIFFGRLIQAALSRQRELLADASAVQFTRNPAGLSRALQKIGRVGSKIESAHAAKASHMFFENGMGKAFIGWKATHPPLEQRIRAIDPSWNGTFTDIGETIQRDPGMKPNQEPT